MRLTVLAAEDWPGVRPEWEALYATTPYRSFFLSALWVDAWLEVFASGLRPVILRFGDSVPEGFCLLAFRRVRRGPFSIRRVHLHTAGERDADSVCVEHNNLLCRPGAEREVADRLFQYVRSLTWDEVVLPGFRPGPPLEALHVRLASLAWVEERRETARVVDLSSLDGTLDAYLARLSRGTRRQIRRSLRDYRHLGEVECRPPANAREAMTTFDELVRLHEETWRRRGRPGAFSSPSFRRFHTRLISNGFDDGAVELLRFVVGSETLGVLYNFIDHERVYCYQSGLSYSGGKRLQPGLVTDALAIPRAADAGLREYDFLSGDYLNKQRLSTGSRPRVWLTYRRRSPRMKLYSGALAAYRGLRRWRSATGGH